MIWGGGLASAGHPPHHVVMPFKEDLVPFRKTRKVTKLATRLGNSAANCVLHVMVNDRGGLVRESGAFLIQLEKLWKARGLDSEQVWAELSERIRLADELRANGIRPRKGGQYRSTKLP
ncbi:hypothetical protein GLF_2010 [Gluconobacter frateurii NBRC 101659]|uniref:hypothetical protein n=1 Tax=Gluconobacter japonicus TaxID=376620 RepID=UPI00029B48D3|nr:hypothetical protein GLF_2010 [Gluconobacter frateurii NBRC 101659]